MAVLSRRNFGNIELLRVDSNPNGTSAPTGSLATLSTNGAVYRNTGGSTWQLVTSLAPLNPANDGPGGIGGGGAGPQGLQGVQGFTGVQGSVGEAGDQGDAGHQGAKGPSGTGGTQGASGPTGAPGDQGAVGATGSQGSPGAQGRLGTTTKGFDGDVGAVGAVGMQGSQGADGVQGATGSAGSVGQSISGAQGAPGQQGDQGPAGFAGAAGAQGSSGAQGAMGSQGAQGSTGPQGSSGATGPGANGSAGAQGAQGATGASGPQGAAGAGASTSYLTLLSSQYVTGASTSSAITFSSLDPDTYRTYLLKGRLIMGGSSAATTYNFTLKPGNISPAQIRYTRMSISGGTSHMTPAPSTFSGRPGTEVSFSMEIHLHKSKKRGMVGRYVGFDVAGNTIMTGLVGWECDTDGSTNITSLTFTADASPNSWIASGSEFHLYRYVY